MAEPTVIKEFLVALGFKVDQKELKKFTDGIADASKQVTKLVRNITGASLAISAGVTAFASSLEGLYFASQRTGAAAGNIKAAEQAARGLGASAQSARSAIESMAAKMRENPANESLFKMMGAQTRDANGQLRDTSLWLEGISKKFQSSPMWLAKQYASQAGFSDEMMLALRSPDFIERFRQAQQKDKGFDQATKDAHAFMERVRQASQELERFAAKFESALLQKAGPVMDRFSVWWDKNADRVADRLAGLLTAVLEFGEKAIPWVEKFFDWLVKLDDATDGWSTAIIGLTTAIVALGGAPVIGAVLGLAGAFLKLGAAASGAGASTAGVLSFLGKAGIAGAAAWGGLQIARAAGLPDTDEAKGWEAIKNGDWLKASMYLPAADFLGASWRRMTGGDPNKPQEAAGPNGGGSKKLSPRDVAMNFFRSMGWSHEQAAGLVANLTHESQLNPGAVGDNGRAYGIAQWHPDRQSAFAKWAGKNIQGSTLDEQLRFMQFELTQGAEKRAGDLLRASTNARAAAEVVSKYYERPLDAMGEAKRRGDSAVQIAQKVDINIVSNDNAQDIGAAAGKSVRQANDELTRTAQGAFG
ncbi:phage tail tip lysozyme [Uliginosibacterium sp. sgz301328]|uniref:phage tail tip lysozyme n=1 Tax=Uliginosibacterium sp. sgz301328 TaxID=3243764 RepID=UPI00359E84EE